MAYYHAAVESRSSATETFGYLATFSNATELDAGVLAGEQLDPGRSRPAAASGWWCRSWGRMPLTYEVIRFVPDREVLLHTANGVLRSTDWIVVTGAADGSTVSYDAEVRLRGPLQALDSILRPGFRGVAERAAAGQARALSGHPPGPGTTTSPGTPVPSGAAAKTAGGTP
jgi:hypothetical protein